ncbi:MAG: hypothetical protein IT355_02290 [Gemmatimonadaceae bacterium]|nr:hypothetical protein [Gemmatimonadaceae bacterium]
MARRLFSSWVVGAMVAGVGFTLQAPATMPVEGGVHARAITRTDLDAFSDARLERDLEDELDDVFEDHNPGDVGDVAEIQEAIMEALADAGDEGAEAEISLADLEAEMDEDGTDVAEVVHEAIARLDHAAAGRPAVFLAAWRGTSDPGYKPTYGLAVRDARRGLIREIRKAR